MCSEPYLEHMAQTISLKLPASWVAEFRELGITGGRIELDAGELAPDLQKRAGAVAARLDAESQLGGCVIATFRSGDIGESLSGSDFIDGLAARAENLGLWPEG